MTLVKRYGESFSGKKILKLDSEKEIAMQETEKIMRKYGITICVRSGVLGVLFEDGTLCSVCDIDMCHGYVDLPRSTESDRLVIVE